MSLTLKSIPHRNKGSFIINIIYFTILLSFLLTITLCFIFISPLPHPFLQLFFFQWFRVTLPPLHLNRNIVLIIPNSNLHLISILLTNCFIIPTLSTISWHRKGQTPLQERRMPVFKVGSSLKEITGQSSIFHVIEAIFNSSCDPWRYDSFCSAKSLSFSAIAIVSFTVYNNKNESPLDNLKSPVTINISYPPTWNIPFRFLLHNIQNRTLNSKFLGKSSFWIKTSHFLQYSLVACLTNSLEVTSC